MNKHEFGDYRIENDEASASRMIEEISSKIKTMERCELNELADALRIDHRIIKGDNMLRHFLKMKVGVLSFKFISAIYDWVFPTYSEDELV
jgi:hypothetical protein